MKTGTFDFQFDFYSLGRVDSGDLFDFYTFEPSKLHLMENVVLTLTTISLKPVCSVTFHLVLLNAHYNRFLASKHLASRFLDSSEKCVYRNAHCIF